MNCLRCVYHLFTHIASGTMNPKMQERNHHLFTLYPPLVHIASGPLAEEEWRKTNTITWRRPPHQSHTINKYFLQVNHEWTQ